MSGSNSSYPSFRYCKRAVSCEVRCNINLYIRSHRITLATACNISFSCYYLSNSSLPQTSTCHIQWFKRKKTCREQRIAVSISYLAVGVILSNSCSFPPNCCCKSVLVDNVLKRFDAAIHDMRCCCYS